MGNRYRQGMVEPFIRFHLENDAEIVRLCGFQIFVQPRQAARVKPIGKPAAGIQRGQLRPRHTGQTTGAAGGAIDSGVVQHDQLIVGGHADVGFDPAGLHPGGKIKGLQSVFRCIGGCAAVHDQASVDDWIGMGQGRSAQWNEGAPP